MTDPGADTPPRPLRARTRIALALLWLALLVVAGWAISRQLELSGDLRRFMPSARTPAQKLLIDELGEGPGSRLLLVSLSGADAETLAAQSRALHARLARDPKFALVANGEGGLEAFPERLRPYRYLLSPTLDAHRFDSAYLREQLQARVEDLGSPAAALVEPLVPSDPTLETLALAEAWEPANAPQRLHGVWFDRTGHEALLAIQTRAAGFDPTGQQAAVDAIRNAYAQARGGAQGRSGHGAIVLSGPGAFSVEIGGRTQHEAGWIGMVDSIGLLLLLFVAYRNWKIPLLGALPLASAGLAGLGAVALLFEGVHGITVAFGFTLIGVAQDYPIHFFSHQRTGVAPWASVRALWPTLATGVASTCIAYLTFFVSGVEGLEQLAVFTIAGLATAALATRFLLPALVDPDLRDPAASPRLERMRMWIARVPQPRWSLLVVALVALAIAAFAPGPFWQNDLSKLTPVPTDALARDAHLRSELGAPDVRYVIAVQGRDVESVLQRTERVAARLDRARAQGGVLDGFDHPARYLPSQRTQRLRQARLPDAATLRSTLDAAVAETPLRADVFEPFLADVATARSATPLAPRDLAGTPLQVRVDSLLLQRPDHATALISLAGLLAPDAVARIAAAEGAQLLDLKQASESLVVAYRERVLWALGLAALLLAATVWIALRKPSRVWRVLAPMALSTALILAALRAAGVELTLFHLVALILAAGLGLDYALFFEHAGDDREEQLRTLHALIVCSLMTLLVFALLAWSSIPVLRAIGTTVALGVVSNFVLGLLIARHPHKAPA
jgi:predicted exporter